MLLNASTKQAFAQISPYQATNLHILDDFTFGNNQEDVDALSLHSNFGGGFNNVPILDDHVWFRLVAEAKRKRLSLLPPLGLTPAADGVANL
jgi:hypothetical protein